VKSRGFTAIPGSHLLRFRVGRLLAHPYVLSAIRLLSVGLFLLILAAGFFGTGSSIKNLAPTMVWVIWWVGLAYVCALVGDFLALINPWRILFSWGEALCRRIAKREGMTPGRPYPRWLGYWPSVLLFWVFAWFELIWHGGEEPLNIALMAAAYSVITWGGMAVFGAEEWLRRGEVFSAVFGLVARFAPMEVRVSNPRIRASARPASRRIAAPMASTATCVGFVRTARTASGICGPTRSVSSPAIPFSLP
jgi:polyferredoxin